MVEQNKSILKNLKDVQSLRGLLKSEMSINGPGEGEVIAKIKVYNDAPASPDGGDIVFLGVGLRITVGRESNGMRRVPTPNKSRPSERELGLEVPVVHSPKLLPTSNHTVKSFSLERA